MAGFELYAGRQPRHRRTSTAVIAGIGIILIMRGRLLPLVPWMVPAHRPPGMPAFDAAHMLLLTGAMVGLTLGWVALFERRGPQAVGFNHHAAGRFLRGYLAGCAVLAAVVCGLWGLGVYTVEGPGVWRAPDLAAVLAILGYAAAFVVQGSSEEVYSRGWMMGTVASRHGLLFAVILNAVLFGAMHLLNPSPLPVKLAGVGNVTLFGVFISLYACWERSLWGVCAFHGAWNWLLGVGFGLEVSGVDLKVPPLIVDLKDAPGVPWVLSGGAWGPEASVLTTVILLAGIVFLLARGALRPGDSYETPEKPLPIVNFVRQ